MTTEQRLTAALRSTERYGASPDLWSRVVHSIEEDRRHRRLVWTAGSLVAVALAAAIVVGALSIEVRNGRNRIDWRVLESLEIGVATALILAMAPAIRRFGRGYVGDIFRTSVATGERLLRLLDVAYYLLFAGYVLITTRLSAPIAFANIDIGDQIEQAAIRLGGLLLLLGVLHAVTLMAMPVVGLVFNTTRAGRRLPRWVAIGLGLVAVATALVALPMMLGLTSM